MTLTGQAPPTKCLLKFDRNCRNYFVEINLRHDLFHFRIVNSKFLLQGQIL